MFLDIQTDGSSLLQGLSSNKHQRFQKNKNMIRGYRESIVDFTMPQLLNEKFC